MTMSFARLVIAAASAQWYDYGERNMYEYVFS